MEKKLYDLMDWAEIEAVVYAEHDHPERILGPQKVRGGFLVQCFLPEAKTVFVKRLKDKKLFAMSEADEAGFFAAFLPGRKISEYELLATYADGTEKRVIDQYLYPAVLSEQVYSDFIQGNSNKAYEILGAHSAYVEGISTDTKLSFGKSENALQGVYFSVWAPGAMRVSVVGEFNNWDYRSHQMIRIGDTGIFGLFVPGITTGEAYSFDLKVSNRIQKQKFDPFSFRIDRKEHDASIVFELATYSWKDKKWMQGRKEMDYTSKPLNILQVDLRDWTRLHPCDEDEKKSDGAINFREIAHDLSAYVKDLGYTHIQLSPIYEYDCDSSGFPLPLSFFSVCQNFGQAQDFMYLVDYFHQSGIGVILEWMPICFSKNEKGLSVFDGNHLFEHLDERQSRHGSIDGLIFNFGRAEVESFLLSNAYYWKEIYHIDGLWFREIASMLYLDYGKAENEWISNCYGGKENLEAIAFLQKCNTMLHAKNDGFLTLAEDNSSWPKMTDSVETEGLGFDYKWEYRWTREIKEYFKIDPFFRKGSHNLLTESSLYVEQEKYIVGFPRESEKTEEVIFGEEDQKEASLRLLYGYAMAYPGKKILAYHRPKRVWEQVYQNACNQLIKHHDALAQTNQSPNGFAWISSLDADHSVISFVRSAGTETLMVICNFTPVIYENFRVGVPFKGVYQEIFNSDQEIYGGHGIGNEGKISSVSVPWDGKENSIHINLPPLGITIFSCIEKGE